MDESWKEDFLRRKLLVLGGLVLSSSEATATRPFVASDNSVQGPSNVHT